MTTADATTTDDSSTDVEHPSGYGLLLVLAGLIGLVAAFTLTHDKLELLQDPDFVPSCDFGTVFSCTDIMKTDQSSVFGFPNPLIGLMAFPVVLTMGVLTLARVRLPEWVWAGFQVGATLGIVFVFWLQYESLYQIGALCPWCMVVWTVMIPTFLYTTVRNMRAWAPDAGVTRFLRDWHALVLALWYVVVVTLIVLRFFV